jgi:hypothetical protein
MEPLAPAPAAPIAPIPVAAPPVAAAPIMQTAPPMGTESSSSSKITDILKNLNWVEVGFGVLGTAALYYTIFYYKYNITMSKSFNNEIQNRVDELSMKIADVSSALENSNQPTQQGFF